MLLFIVCLKKVPLKIGISGHLKILKKYPVKNSFEFRNQSWFCPKVFRLLKKYQAALCIADSPRYPLVEKVTADFIYLRFHGSKSLYGSRYTDKELKDWAEKIKKWLKQGKDIYVYFNNDVHGYAIKNTKQLKKLCKSYQ